jgi:hypothetical protein
MGGHSDPSPDHLPRIHAFISLYPLDPQPSIQPGPLPALPALVDPAFIGHKTTLITMYPSTSVIHMPFSFSNQVLTRNHQLLSDNLRTAGTARVVSIFLGDVRLPRLPEIISAPSSFDQRMNHSPMLFNGHSPNTKLQLAATKINSHARSVKSYLSITFRSLFSSFLARWGVGSTSADYKLFETRLLSILRPKTIRSSRYSIGQMSFVPLMLSRLPLPILPYAFGLFARYMPGNFGPEVPDHPQSQSQSQSQSQGSSSSRRERGRRSGRTGQSTATTSSSEREHDAEKSSASEDQSNPEVLFAASIASGSGSGSGSGSQAGSTASNQGEADMSSSTHSSSSFSSGVDLAGSRLEDSWVGLDAADSR